MKTAIVCDWLVTPGGAEKVLSEIIQCFPDADIFAVVDFVDEMQRDFLHHKKVVTTFIQNLPLAKKYYRSYLPLMPLAIEQLDLTAYDLIISSSHAVAKGVLTGPDQLHVSYVHSPMRYAWDLQFQYLRETGLDKKLHGYVARYFLHKLRIWDSRSTNGVDYLIANSNFIARRIQKIYRRSAETIYPPVDIDKFKPHVQKEEYYCTASRLVPYKKIDLIVESFHDMPNKNLIVIGQGPDYEKIKHKASKNVHMLGYQPINQLIHYLQRAKAFIFAAEEDFGIVPLEAQACGTPVIAYGKGGLRETIRDTSHEKPTGVFFNAQTTEAIHAAIHYFEKNQQLFTAEHCVENASRFKPENFRNQFKKFVEEKYRNGEVV